MRFVLIDRLVELQPGQRARGRKTFSASDGIFDDHFPGFPVVPGVLLTEAMGQVGGWLLAATLGFHRWPLLIMIQGAKFRRLVQPGQELDLDAAIKSARGDDFEIEAEARAGGQRVAHARLVFHAFDFTLPDPDERRFEAWARTTFRELGGEDLLRDAASSGIGP